MWVFADWRLRLKGRKHNGVRMPDAAYVLLGIVFGVFAGVYLASRHSHRLKRLVEDEKRLAVRAVRSATDQLSTRLEQREHELAQFQNRLDDERKTAELGVSKIKADFARLTDRKEKLEKFTKELESHTGVLKIGASDHHGRSVPRAGAVSRRGDVLRASDRDIHATHSNRGIAAPWHQCSTEKAGDCYRRPREWGTYG